MSHDRIITAALREAGIDGTVRNQRALTGGCIHEVVCIELSTGQLVVAKIARAGQAALLEEEHASLAALEATRTVLVPTPLAMSRGADASVLLTTFWLSHRAGDTVWRVFGEELARLHARPAGARYGFDADNHIGATTQPNAWHDDWVEFNRTCRLGHQLELARQNDLLARDEAKRIERVIDRLDELIPRTPKPALLHGDLWSGNALSTVDKDGQPRIAVIDPACSFGDGWADLAMMQLFGGFPRLCIEAYEANVSDHAQRETRTMVYQLYHVLNHVNLFGRGYIAQAMALTKSLGA